MLVVVGVGVDDDGDGGVAGGVVTGIVVNSSTVVYLALPLPMLLPLPLLVPFCGFGCCRRPSNPPVRPSLSRFPPSSLQVCLKYVVLANMLALSDINPFAAREAKV